MRMAAQPDSTAFAANLTKAADITADPEPAGATLDVGNDAYGLK
jgi:hypothetical protein